MPPTPSGPSYQDAAPPPLRPPGANGFALAALWLAVPACSLPLSIVFGILALRQIRVSGQPGRGLAIAGLAISGAWLAALAVVLVAVPAKHPSSPIFQAHAGDCFQRTSSDALAPASCDEPHHAEVFRTLPLTGHDRPKAVTAKCAAEAKQYFASSTPPDYIGIEAHYPSEKDTQLAVCTLESERPTTGRVVH